MSHRVLLEIGMEECPARFMPRADQQIERLIAEQFRAARISFETVRSMGTPRRLTVWVDGVAEKQEDLAEEVKGPPKQAAFDAEGRPTKAAEGFARKQGLSVDELEVRETEQGSYVYAKKRAGAANARSACRSASVGHPAPFVPQVHAVGSRQYPLHSSHSLDRRVV